MALIEKKSKNVIRNNLYFLSQIWKICPSRVVLTFVSTFIDFGMWTFSSVIFMQYLFGSADGMRDFSDVLWFIWFAVALGVADHIFSAWFYNSFVPRTDIIIHCKLNTMLFKKAQNVDLSCYETPEFYNNYTKAANEAGDRATNVLDYCALLVSSVISSAFVVVAMVTITPWALLFIALPLVGNLGFGKKLGKIMYDIDTESTPANRRSSYVNRVIYFRKYAGELRMTNVFKLLSKMYNTAVDEAVEVNLKYAAKRFAYSMAKSLLMYFFGFEGMWVCAAILAIGGTITVSDLVVLLNAIVSVSWMINDVERSISGIFTNAFFIENLKQFLNYEPKIDESVGGLPPPEQVDTIEFRDVSFRYIGQENYALRNVSLTFKRGVRHALVGVNGSGKSTLIKLILRFYDPEEGQILLNGVDIREYDVKLYRQIIGVAFQDFALFAATVLENVLLRVPNDVFERETAIGALKDSDVYPKVQTLKYKEDTMLTREFDNQGAELSGGERQKIAIARAFAKNSPIVILDEPSAALDPIAEFRMFQTINHLCEGDNKLSIIVSHRLSSAAVCEKIFVFEKGELLEQGAHAELIKANGTYADMFLKQARNYQVEEVSVYE